MKIENGRNLLAYQVYFVEKAIGILCFFAGTGELRKAAGEYLPITQQKVWILFELTSNTYVFKLT